MQYLAMVSPYINQTVFCWPKFTCECFFINLKYINYENSTFDLSPLHIIDSKPLRGRIRPWIKEYMAFVNNSDNIYRNTLIPKILRGCHYYCHYSQYYSLYVGFDGSLFYNQMHYRYKYEEWDRFGIRGPCIGRVDELIVLGNNYTRENFGHSFQDLLHSLTLIPLSVRKRAKILMTMLPVAYDVVEMLGVNKSQEVFLNKGEWIYASHIHIIDKPSPILTLYGDVAINFIHFLRTKLGVYNITADKYYFTNRKKGIGRHIINFNMILNITRKIHPDIDFRYMDSNIENIWDGAKKWATVKFLYSPPGSNVIKPYFMNEYSVIVTPLGTMMDRSIHILNALGKIFVIHHFDRHFIHDRSSSSYISVARALEAIDAGIYCSINRKWPNNVYTYKNISKKELKKIDF